MPMYELDERSIILPEEHAPLDAQQCERCELSKQRSRVIWGEGNPQAPILLVLDNPGAREDGEEYNRRRAAPSRVDQRQ